MPMPPQVVPQSQAVLDSWQASMRLDACHVLHLPSILAARLVQQEPTSLRVRVDGALREGARLEVGRW